MVLQKVGEFLTTINVNGNNEGSFNQAEDSTYNVSVGTNNGTAQYDENGSLFGGNEVIFSAPDPNSIPGVNPVDYTVTIDITGSSGDLVNVTLYKDGNQVGRIGDDYPREIYSDAGSGAELSEFRLVEEYNSSTAGFYYSIDIENNFEFTDNRYINIEGVSKS